MRTGWNWALGGFKGLVDLLKTQAAFGPPDKEQLARLRTTIHELTEFTSQQEKRLYDPTRTNPEAPQDRAGS